MTTKILDEDDDHICIQCNIVHETGKAVALNGTKGALVWLPKSEIEIVRGFEHQEITIPMWLFMEKDVA